MTTTTQPKIKYADTVGEYELLDRPAPTRGMMGYLPGQQADGYGRKISTNHKLRFNGEKREYRVYCICFSNAGSNYIIRKGETLYLRG